MKTYKYILEEPLILASSSPRRRELLNLCLPELKIVVPECEEIVLEGETAEQMVRRLSLAKAQMVADSFPQAWVLAADTTVYLENKILNKPASAAEAFQMLKSLAGKWHVVWGGITLINKDKNISITQAHCTDVLIRRLSDGEINEFIETGEAMDKAGAYAIQGVGACLVSEIKGSYTNVVGLNLSAVLDLLISNSIIR